MNTKYVMEVRIYKGEKTEEITRTFETFREMANAYYIYNELDMKGDYRISKDVVELDYKNFKMKCIDLPMLYYYFEVAFPYNPEKQSHEYNHLASLGFEVEYFGK